MTQDTNNKITLSIDGQDVTVDPGTLLIEAAKQVGAEIPHFCYHKKLKPDANCRMCLVAIEKAPKLQTACSTPVAQGMVVRTNTPDVTEAHKSVLAEQFGVSRPTLVRSLQELVREGYLVRKQGVDVRDLRIAQIRQRHSVWIRSWWGRTRPVSP